MPTKKANRILSIKIRKMADEDPDTSWLGEYSDTRESEYSIDRAHTAECQIYRPEAKTAMEQLERAIDYLSQQYDDYRSAEESGYVAIRQTQGRLEEAQEELRECDCHQRLERGTYRYFNPAQRALSGDTPEEIRGYVKADFERMEAYNNDQWSFVGIRAEAEIQTGSDVVHTIRSGGLWGIESDSDDSYFKEVANEELHSLRQELSNLGFSKRAIAAAVKERETIEV